MRFFLLSLLFAAATLASAQEKKRPPDVRDLPGYRAAAAGRWSAAQAAAWRERRGWLVGCNYLPATAINQLEMWQADTFDPATIDRELALARGLGFHSLRVYLHHLLWEQDAQGFLQRLDRFLDLAAKHQIGVMFVLFDSCWDPHPRLGKQPAPRPGLHNSGWVQSPGAAVLLDRKKQAGLEDYVRGVVGRFRDDARVQAWDLWNEPDNTNGTSYGKLEPKDKPDLVLPLLVRTFAWARQARPSQPLTSGVWQGTFGDPERLRPMERVQLELSDVISFHNYGPLDQLQQCVRHLRRYDRPLLCTEYMARPAGSTFEPHLAWLKEEGVAAYNWGFVAGKSQTIYPWDSWRKAYDAEPKEWFHDIFRRDGTPFRPAETDYIRKVTGAKAR